MTVVVRTAFFDGGRDQKLMTLDFPAAPPLWSTGDGDGRRGPRLVVAFRPAVERDWVNGEFVGDHKCPTDGPHVHGAPR